MKMLDQIPIQDGVVHVRPDTGEFLAKLVSDDRILIPFERLDGPSASVWAGW